MHRESQRSDPSETSEPEESNSGDRRKALDFRIAWIAILASFLCLFGRVFWNTEVFAFRDAANFYFPLFEWQCREWSAGRVPLWNPYDNLGTPILADASSSVLYPGKLIFALPCDYATRLNLYIASHVLLAAATAYQLGRHWGCSALAAAIGAIGYAFGGQVLFQSSNVVYLVGAAWLPLAIGRADSMLIERRVRRAIEFGVVLALMTLGGDPQTAYHAGLLAVVQSILLWRNERGKRNPPPLPHQYADESPAEPRLSAESSIPRPLTRQFVFPGILKSLAAKRGRPILLFAAMCTGLALSAVQVLPSLDWAGRSHRARYDLPRNIYEAARSFIDRETQAGDPSSWPQDIGHGLLGKPRTGTHSEHTYFFSLGPWRCVELIWPNVSGKMFPLHHRWLTAIPAEGRTWVPTLYLGLITMMGVGCAWRWRAGTDRERWAICMVMLGIGASFGWYGLGWIIHELRSAVASRADVEPWIGQPVGGIYWLLVVLLPGYAYFRYPAKWFVVAALGLSLLGARGIERAIAGDKRAGKIAGWIAVISCVMVAILVLGRPVILDRLKSVPASPLFGPLDEPGSWRDVVLAFVHAALVAISFLCVLRSTHLQRWMRPAIWLLILAAVDITLANRWMIGTVPSKHLTQGPSVADSFSQQVRSLNQPAARAIHIGRAAWIPRAWRETSDPQRLSQIVAWERNALLHKYHLQREIAMLDTSATLASAEFQSLLKLVRNSAMEQNGQMRSDAEPLLGALGVEELIIHREFPIVGQQVGTDREFQEQERWWGDVHAVSSRVEVLSRAWIVHDVRPLSRLPAESGHSSTTRVEDFEEELRRIWFVDGNAELRDPREKAFIDNLDSSTEPDSAGTAKRFPESCIVTHYEPQLIDIDVEIVSPGMLVVSDLYDPGWKASVKSAGREASETVDVVRVNRLIRGIRLPSGKHQVTLRYRPTSFLVGGICSAVTCIVLAIFWIIRAGNPRPK